MAANKHQTWISDLTSNRPLADVITGSPTTIRGGNSPQSVRDSVDMPNLHVGRGYRYGNLDWYPIWSDAETSKRNYITEAVHEDIRISELAQPNVGWLEITNIGAKDLVILEGTFIEAGFQHRALVSTVVVSAGETQVIPVVCIERGRWGGAHGQRLGSRRAPAKVRGALRGIRSGIPAANSGSVDQGEVWQRVAEYSRDLNRHSGTESLVEMRQSLEVEVKLPKVRALAGQIGVLIAIGGHPVALEVFDHPRTLAENLDSIVAGYLPDISNAVYRATPGHRVRSFVQKACAKTLRRNEQNGRFINQPDALIATQATEHKGRFVHISTLNARHELVLAA